MPAIDVVIAFAGGVVSFLSPCVLPLVPVYLSITTGLGVAELESGDRRSLVTVARGAGLFVAGFSVVFIALGMSVTALGATLLRHQAPITRLAGVVVVVMALVMLASTVFGGRLTSRELRFHPRLRRGSTWTAPIAGAAFAFGWTPCIGPVLGSVLAVAASQGGVVHGGVLLAFYSAGLAVPFLATGLLFHRAVGALRWTREHSVALVRASAGLLGAYGAILAFDQLSWMTLRLQQAAEVVGLSGLITLG